MDDEARVAVYDAVLAAAAAAHERMRKHDPLGMCMASEAIGQALRQGRKVLVFGNGGSAADAQHLAAELVVRLESDRAPIAALALTTDTSVLTAMANDYGFEGIFARQIEALGRPGDIAIAISTSGASKNVLAGVEAARKRGLYTVAFTGRDGGALAGVVDMYVNVPESNTARVQEVHRTLLHILCQLVEKEVAENK